MSEKQNLSVPVGTPVIWRPHGDGPEIPCVVLKSYPSGQCELDSLARRQRSPSGSIRHRSDPLLDANREMLREEGCWDWVKAPAWGPHAVEVVVEDPEQTTEQLILATWDKHKDFDAVFAFVRSKGVKKAEVEAVLEKHGKLETHSV